MASRGASSDLLNCAPARFARALCSGRRWRAVGGITSLTLVLSLAPAGSADAGKGPATPSVRASLALLPGTDRESRSDRLALSESRQTADAPAGEASLSAPGMALSRASVVSRGLDDHRRMVIAPGYTITHYVHSAPLGSSGNAVLYGHNDIEGAVFRYLEQLAPGDLLFLHLGKRTVRYRVTRRFIVKPSALEILEPTAGPRLTLFTCWPYRVDNQRVVITAIPED